MRSCHTFRLPKNYCHRFDTAWHRESEGIPSCRSAPRQFPIFEKQVQKTNIKKVSASVKSWSGWYFLFQSVQIVYKTFITATLRLKAPLQSSDDGNRCDRLRWSSDLQREKNCRQNNQKQLGTSEMQRMQTRIPSAILSLGMTVFLVG